MNAKWILARSRTVEVRWDSIDSKYILKLIWPFLINVFLKSWFSIAVERVLEPSWSEQILP